MSREVDERVVQMQFDNAQFERETKRSLNTIEKLKSSLNFDKSKNYFDGINKSASKVSLTPVGDQVDGLRLRFSTLDTIAITVISDITRKVEHLGLAVTKAFIIDPVKSGLQEYETQINSVQTILANTQAKGTTLEQVNAALDELNRYADMTIYNFTEMTRNIGTFTAAGVGLETSVQAIKGIANLAAVSGSTSQQASNAMYQLSQAIASGTVKLMDWNSVVNAGMGGQVFQDALKETARVHGVAIDEMIAKEGSFRETLSKGWLTSSILTETLAKFTGDLSEAELRAIGYTEEQIDSIIKMGETANDAATKVKTFTQLIDTLKESVQSGWTQSWEYIIGDFEESKELWTEISNSLSEIINKTSDARNSLLKGGLASGWKQLTEEGIADSVGLLQNVLINLGKKTGRITDSQLEMFGGFEKSLKYGWVNSELLVSGIKEIVTQAEKLSSLSDEELLSLGYSRSSIDQVLKSYTELNEQIENETINIEELTKSLSRDSGRENLIQSLRNVASAFYNIASPVKKAFESVFETMTSEKIYSFTVSLEKATANFKTFSQSIAPKLNKAFTGVFSIVKLGVNAFETLAGSILKVLKTLSPLAIKILDLSAYLGDFAAKLSSTIEASGLFDTVLLSVEKACNFVSLSVQKVISSFSTLYSKTSIVIDPLRWLSDSLKSFVNFIAPGLYYFGTTASKAFGEFSKSALTAFTSFDPTNLYNFINAGLGYGILTSIYNFIDSGKKILDGAGGIVESIKDIFSSFGDVLDEWKNAKKSETLLTIAKAVGILSASLFALSILNPERLSGALLSITALFTELIASVTILNSLNAFKTFGFISLSSTLISLSSSVLVLSAALNIIASIDSDKMMLSVSALGLVLTELTISATILSGNVRNIAKGTSGLVLMATAVRILASSIKVFSDISFESLVKGIGSLGVILTELAVFSIAMSKFGGSIGLLNGISFNLLASSLLILQKSIEKFGNMNLSQLAKGLSTIGIILLEFSAFSFLNKFSKHIISSSLAFSIMAASLNLLINPMKTLGDMDISEIGKALLAIGGALTEFVLAMNLVKSGIGTSASFAVMSLSVVLLAKAFSELSEVPLSSIGKTLLSVAGALTVFGVAAFVLGPVTPIITALSVSLSLFAASLGFLLVAASSAQLISNLAGSLALLSTLNFSAFLQAIKNLAWMVVEFIAGVIKGFAEIASTIASSIAKIVTAICEGIVQAAPAIGNAITTLVITLCGVIRETAPIIAETVVYLIGELWTAIKNALYGLWSNIWSWLDTNIFSHDWFGIGEFISNFKSIWISDAEKAGADVAKGYANGMSSESESISSGIESLANKAAETWNSFWGIHSPSRLAAEASGYVVSGYIAGIENGISDFVSSIWVLSEKANTAFRDFWGIHSPSDLAMSDAENIAIGLTLGMANETEAAKRTAKYLATHTADGLKTRIASETAWAAGIRIGEDYVNGLKSSDIGNELSTWLSLVFGVANNQENPTPTTIGSTKTEKTAAEKIEDAYKAKLEANKLLQEAAEAEYELWLTENQNGASSDELLAKKLEYTATEIENQTDRVAIAQAKYDEMLRTLGADATETKEAYVDLLDEKNTLANLKADRLNDLYSEELERLGIESEQLDKEYELWTSQNNSASDATKTNEKVEYYTSKLAISAKELTAAQSQYEVMLAEFGESDLRTKEAYNEYLQAQIDYQNLANSLTAAQLESFDNALAIIDRESSLYSQRASILSKIYDDGDLSSRANDYLNAVETYGAASEEARRAKYQGTASSVLGVATALKNMSYQLNRTSVYQKKYDKLLASNSAEAEDLAAAQSQILSSSSAFIDYAEDLAEAFNMDKEGKAITLRLAYAISDNWKNISVGLEDAWSKVKERIPELATKVEDAFGVVFSDTGIEIGTSLVSTIVSAMSGDIGSALVSGLNTVLSFASSEVGQTVIANFGSMLSSVVPEIIGTITSFIGSSGSLSSIGSTIMGVVGSITSGGGLIAGLEGVGTAIMGLVASVPELLPIIAIIGAIAGLGGLLIANWEDVGEFFSNLWNGMIEIASNLFDGLIEGIKSAWHGFTSFIEGIFGGIIDIVKGIFGINSPSVEFYKIGEFIDQGFIDGINSSAKHVGKSVSDMTSAALDTARVMNNSLYDAINSGPSLGPTITPVVDLSSAKDSTNWLRSSLSGMGGAVNLEATRSANLAVEANIPKNQNGKVNQDSSRSDVVRAIATLSDKVAMMGESIEHMQIVMDSGKLVGSILPKMDSALGTRIARTKRGG